ncbi:MAG: sugar transferase [Pseudomonadota bacterium]|nr:MAG: sugar transferase [Pseudomonadota bacterium]
MTRVFDILFSLITIVALTPLWLIVIPCLRLSGEGEVFFRQERVGRGGEMFGLLKFATMLKDSPNLATGTVTVKDDPRVLPFGKFLRKTKLNELPQLINILKGDMSIIGPRPQTRRCFEAFPARSQRAIIKVRPGLSGVGFVVFRGEDQMMGDSANADELYDRVIMPYKGLLEEWFVANRSLRIYFLLIFITAWMVVFLPCRFA